MITSRKVIDEIDYVLLDIAVLLSVKLQLCYCVVNRVLS